MSNKILTFGEIIMRLSSRKQNHEADEMEFLRWKLNVASSLATMGCEVKHISVFLTICGRIGGVFCQKFWN
jgi:2-dehydro-3-deoxygluconokinase